MDNLQLPIVNEIKVTGRAERILIDKVAKLFYRISRWTHASDVEFDDGKTAQEKVGNINGITSDFEEGSIDIAASSVLTKEIKANLNDGIINEHIQLVIDEDGNLGWKKDGADAVIPFSRYDVKAASAGRMPNGSTSSSISITVPEGVKYGLLICISTGWMGELSQGNPSGSGINSIMSTKRNQLVFGICSNITAIYECKFNSSGAVSLSFANNSSDHKEYSTAQLILIA